MTMPTMLTLLAMLWIAPTMPQGAVPPAPNAAAAESPLVIDPPHIDLGAIAPGSVQTRTFTLRNVSGKPVTIVSA
ncbi:MAG: hypothetical protein EBR71_09340, partial [Planctomycetes bacterium]|nr:hypothetical protein [Planctomycetota bacterium]